MTELEKNMEQSAAVDKKYNFALSQFCCIIVALGISSVTILSI